MCACQCIQKCIQTQGAFSDQIFIDFIFFTLIYMYKKIDTLKNKVYDKNMYTSKLLRSVFFFNSSLESF